MRFRLAPMGVTFQADSFVHILLPKSILIGTLHCFSNWK